MPTAPTAIGGFRGFCSWSGEKSRTSSRECNRSPPLTPVLCVSPIVARPGEGPLTEPTPAGQPYQGNGSSCPRRRPWPGTRIGRRKPEDGHSIEGSIPSIRDAGQLGTSNNQVLAVI